VDDEIREVQEKVVHNAIGPCKSALEIGPTQLFFGSW